MSQRRAVFEVTTKYHIDNISNVGEASLNPSIDSRRVQKNNQTRNNRDITKLEEAAAYEGKKC